ncbi:MAG: orotidine-5-phosphate decarboxylase [Clostridiales bacterium]|jgi:orotidine-5'-phosphate decarboxylase|nr:orotidine-5-phosphate decarboxylase [Clostridiales bacterium]
MISDQLIQQIISKKAPIVVGLDPNLEHFPKELLQEAFDRYGETMEGAASAIKNFNRGIIDAVADVVPAIKPQIAYFEQYGVPGLEAFQDACRYAKEKGLIVIGDIKRGDIGTTSDAYATAFLGQTTVGQNRYAAFETDMVTVNPYLGDDSIRAFVEQAIRYGKGIFILVKTSNKSSAQVQDLFTGNIHVYDRIAEMVDDWNAKYTGKSGYSPIGAVVGATYPEELDALRKRMPRAFFLVPGYGAQGGGAADVVGAFNSDGLGAVVNSSRGILYAYKKTGTDYKEAAREAALQMREAINAELEKAGKRYW